MSPEDNALVGIMIAAMFMMLLAITSCKGPTGPTGPVGPQGEIGPKGDSAVLEWVDPCPELATPFPELLMLIDDVLYAVYAHGPKIHLTKLTPGDYQTTDGRGCSFTIDVLGRLQ